jgi:hypothetical protein
VTVAQLSAVRIASACWQPRSAPIRRCLATIRDLALLDEIVAATQNQFDCFGLASNREPHHRLERDLLDVELRRVQADRLLQAGRTETAVFELKRVSA